MISKNDILKFVRHVHRRGQGVPDRRPIHPRREWLTGLTLFLIATGTGALFSMITFEQYKTIDTRTYTADIAIPVYNEARARTVLEDFAARKDVYRALTSGVDVVSPEPVPPEDVTTSTTTTETIVPVSEEVIEPASALNTVE